jgi:hypothetical protein
MQRFVRALVWPLVWWGQRPAVSDPLEQTAWQRGRADMAAGASAHPLWGLLVTVLSTVLGASLVTDTKWRVPLALLGAVVGYCVVPLLWALVSALRAPYRQRDEARALVREAHSLNDLIALDRQLRGVLASSNRLLDEVRERGFRGPLGEDDDPWIRFENENMERWLESSGFPELVPKIVLDRPVLGTWEDVKREARRFSQNIDAVLRSELLADVQHLRETAAE